MNLKRQLLLVSLLTLLLPWAGCEFIRETESALRQSQQQMLSGTARAVAESLERYPEEFPAQPNGNVTAGDQLYGHRLDTEPLIDGYLNDWSLPPDALRQIRGTDGPIRFVVGLHGRYVYFYTAVTDDDVVYASPSTIAIEDGPTYADRVVLISANPPMASESLTFAAEAPGPVIALFRSSFGFAPEPSVLARWQDAVGGRLARLQADRAAERDADTDVVASPGAEEESVEAPAMDHGDMDHSEMDHSKMEHSEMDHSAMDHAGSGDS